MTSRRYRIKEGYRARSSPAYFEDAIADDRRIVHQPDVYPFARHVALGFGCDAILDVGCGHAHKLATLHPELKVTGLDIGPNIAWARAHHRFGRWIEHDLEAPLPDFPASELGRTAVVCSDVIEHLVDPEPLLTSLARLLDHAPVLVLSTPERDRVRGLDDMGPPANPAHVREWNQRELEELLVDDSRLNVAFLGLTRNNDRDSQKRTLIAVVHKNGTPRPGRSAPPDFSVIAYMTAYNEVDILEASVARLADQGVKVYLIDNWSDDGTYELASGRLRPLLAGLERFPIEGPSRYYEWHALLSRVEELALVSGASWCIHHDVDEAREPCWRGVSLRDALYTVDEMGFNAVDHTVINFHPIDEGFAPGTRFDEYFRYWDFGGRPGHFSQIKAWKRQSHPVRLAATGGHEVEFPGRRTFPYKFLLRHYPVRSTEHGRRKIFAERLSRYSPDERRIRGWHSQYDHLGAGTKFLRSAADLHEFDRALFYDEFLVERLSGGSIPRDGTSGGGGGRLKALQDRLRTLLSRLRR